MIAVYENDEWIVLGSDAIIVELDHAHLLKEKQHTEGNYQNGMERKNQRRIVG